MKKLCLLFFVGAAVLGTTNQAWAQKKQSEADKVSFYNHVWDVVINQGRPDILDTAYAADVVIHNTPEIKGKDAAKAYFTNFVTGFSDRKFTIVNSFAKGDQVVKYWRFSGTHSGVFFGIPASGKKIDVIGCTIAKVVDGKITEEQDFMDNLELFQQLGLIPR